MIVPDASRAVVLEVPDRSVLQRHRGALVLVVTREDARKLAESLAAALSSTQETVPPTR